MTGRMVVAMVAVLMAAPACSRAPAESGARNATYIGGNDNGPIPDNAAGNSMNSAAPSASVAVLPPSASHPEDLPASNDMVADKPFPQEVTDYMVSRDGCDHFRGEEPYDADRRAYLNDNIRTLCTGTDAKLAALRKQYADRPDVTEALQNYEDVIELPPGH